MNIRLVGADLFHADRRTDRHDEANSRFLQLYESTSNVSTCQMFCALLQSVLC